MHPSKSLILKSALFGVAFTSPAAVLAQIEEIVVTAQRREESVQDVPIAINAITGDQLDDLGIFGADDLEQNFVGITTNNSSAVNAGISIRGVGTSSFHVSTQQSVAVYIDNVYQISPFTSAIGVFDMERVEVLRGPQNTLYGRNTTGGAVNFHTRDPRIGEEFNGYGRITGGTGDRRDIEAAIGGAFNDNWAGRIAISSTNYDGILDAVNTGEPVDERNAQSIRATLVWEPTDNFDANLKFTHGEADGDDTVIFMDGPLNADGTGPCPTFDRFAFEPGPNDCTISLIQAAINATPYLANLDSQGLLLDDPNAVGARKLFQPGGNIYDDEGDVYDFEYDILNLHLTWQLSENIQFESITSYLDQFFTNFSAGSVVSFNANQLGDWEVWQQELRLSSTGDTRFRWIGGLYYMDSESQEDTWVNVPNLPPSPSNSILIDAFFESVSAYGQIDYDIAENLTLTAGLRWSEETLEAPPIDASQDLYRYRKFLCAPGGTGTGNTSANIGRDYQRDFRVANCPEILLGSPAGTPQSVLDATNSYDRSIGPFQQFDETGYNLRLSWFPTENILLYGSVGYGFKGGAFDNRALALGDNPMSPEFIDAMEIGIKSTLADGTLRVNAAYYAYDWEDIQLFEVLPTGPELNNIPRAENNGIEMDLIWQPNDAWNFNFQALWAETELVDVSGLSVTSQAQSGGEFEGNPEASYNASMSHTWDLANASVTLWGQYRHMGENFTALSNDPRDTAPSINLLNARLITTFGADRQHELAIWGNNLTEEFLCQAMANGPGPGDETWGCVVDRLVNGNRLWGISFESRF